jgi:hypothetical protein
LLACLSSALTSLFDPAYPGKKSFFLKNCFYIFVDYMPHK